MKRTILLYYVPIIVSVMIIGSLYPYATTASIILAILFLPVAILLWLCFFKIKKTHISTDEQTKILFATKKMIALLLYSTVLSLIIFVGAIIKATSFREFVIDILFIPVVIQFLFWLGPLLRGSKKVK